METALELELGEGSVIADNVGDQDCVFLAGLYRAEQGIAGHLMRLAQGALPWPTIDVDMAIPWLEQKTDLTFAESQKQAIRPALASKVLVVTGGPGVGKTTLLNAILRVLAVKGVRIALCAPTGRVAKRMSEAIGMEAKTIHRLLEVNPRFGSFQRDEETPLDYGKDVYNGDLGYVVDIQEDDGDIVIDFDSRRVTYGYGELDQVVLAYATIIHKSQGSEYPVVVIPIITQHYPTLQRNLLYTGVTRGRKLVILLGQRKAVAIAVKGAVSRRRWSKLGEWLAEAKPDRLKKAAVTIPLMKSE